jgi:RNA polymerase sigma-70 factor (ECF subfamily)
VTPGEEQSAFAATRWTLVLRARGETPEARAALSELCEAYWDPVFRFLRREGRDEDTSRELTQAFFEKVLAGRGLAGANPGEGRFRPFLLGALKHFLADERDRRTAAKRGGGQTVASLDSLPDAGDSRDSATSPPPDSFFDRQWALSLMERVLGDLAQEMDRDGRDDQFALLKPWLVGDTDAESQAAAAAKLGMNEGAVKVAVHRLRKRFRERIRAAVSHTVEDARDVDGELRYLVEALSWEPDPSPTRG